MFINIVIMMNLKHMEDLVEVDLIRKKLFKHSLYTKISVDQIEDIKIGSTRSSRESMLQLYTMC